MTADDSRGPATEKSSPQGRRTAHSAKKKTSHGREQERSEKGRLPGNAWEDAPAEGQTHPAWSVTNAVITAVAATKLWLRQRRNVRKQTWWTRLTKTCRRMRTNARDASMRAREAAAEPTPKEHRGRMATAAVGILVALEWLRRRRDADRRSDHSR